MQESKIIKLKSRYSDVHTTLEILDKDIGFITSDGHYVRSIGESTTYPEAIDFEGGPMLNVGDTIEGTNKIITNFYSIKGGYIVRFKTKSKEDDNT